MTRALSPVARCRTTPGLNRRRPLLACGVSFLILTGAAQPAPAGPDTKASPSGPITGKVLDIRGQPIPAARIQLFRRGPSRGEASGAYEFHEEVASDTDGKFHLSSGMASDVLIGRHAGLAPAWFRLSPLGGEPCVTLVAPTVLAGEVVDTTGKPVAGAEVHVASASSETSLDGRRSRQNLSGPLARDLFSTRTGGDGRFRIQAFPTNASARLLVRAPGLALKQEAADATAQSSPPWLAGREDIRLVLEPTGIIEGRIRLGDPNAAPPAAVIRIDAADPRSTAPETNIVATAADGSFRLVDVPAGTYSLSAAFGANPVPEWAADNVSARVGSGETARGVELLAVRGGVLEVATLTRGGGRPVADVRIQASKDTLRVRGASGRDGIARLRLTPGSYQLIAGRDGWPSETGSAEIADGATNRVVIELVPPPTVAVTVRRPDGEPAANVAVRILGHAPGPPTLLRTDADGRLAIELRQTDPQPGPLMVCLLAQDVERNLAVAADLDADTASLDLKLEPAVTLVGRAQSAGMPVTNATAHLVFWTGKTEIQIDGLSATASAPGQFEIAALPPGRRYGLGVSAPGCGRRSLDATSAAAQPGRAELEPVELCRADLSLAGCVVDAENRPVADARVHISGEGQPTVTTRTDGAGRFAFDQVCKGPVELYANSGVANSSVIAQGGDTNLVIVLSEAATAQPGTAKRALAGSVTGPDGQPAAGARLAVFPAELESRATASPDGAFRLEWSAGSSTARSAFLLVARDPARNLAAIQELPESITNLSLRLEPAFRIHGRVEDPDGAPLSRADVFLLIMNGKGWCQIDAAGLDTNHVGEFAIDCLPHGPRYTVAASAPGYGRFQQEIETDPDTNIVRLEPIVLPVADQLVAGQVVNVEDKPVAGAQVALSGEGQPEESTTTDREGRFRFKVCEGAVSIVAFEGASGSAYASVEAESGDTNLVIQVVARANTEQSAPERASLVGKPLPNLAPLGLAPDAAAAGQPLLLCLLDIEQRPSRRVAQLLAEQCDSLRRKGLTVLAIHAGTQAGALDQWRSASPVPFPIVHAAEDNDALRWVRKTDSLPWLIVTDADRRVIAEGFPIEELEAHIRH